MANIGKKISVLAYYHKANRYSFHALLGALEGQPDLTDIPTMLASTPAEIQVALDSILPSNSLVILAISMLTSQVDEHKTFMQGLLQKYDKQKLFYIAGGAHTTASPQMVLDMGFDAVAIGEGEKSFPEIVRCLYLGKDWHDIPGIAYMQADKLIHNLPTSHCILDDYFPLSSKIPAIGPLEITRGCPNTCYFCQTPYIFGTYPRHRSIDKICETARWLASFGPHDLRFITPNILNYGSPDGKTVVPEALEELFSKLKEILAPGGRLFLGSFPSEVRPDFVSPQTIGILKKYASNDNITLGAQSGSQRILDLCHRGHTVEQVLYAVTLCHEMGFKTNVDFIFGLPGETSKDIETTIDMIQQLAKMGSKIHAHAFMPLPQTPFQHSVSYIPQRYRDQIERLASQGIVFGQWKHQEKWNHARKSR